MKISTRSGKLGTSNALFAYRPRERSQSLAVANETKSGFWIVSYGHNQPSDVAQDKRQAETMLHDFFAGLGNY